MRRTSLLVCSTLHIPQEERMAIDRLILAATRDADGRLAVCHPDLLIESFQFGFFVHTGVCADAAGRPDSVSPEFWAIMRAATSTGASWVLFDRDEPLASHLPVF
ncbi:hypothetical protein [Sphingobium subterraneum]|uniref:DUF5983 domain-containing protein n=1 Tax=Sphingobium subterraneum TaxID=627688 RepID=A0A841IXN5_9SPHN|nr:hypothetical protein [Sphingobium subterraneum]MBB6122902.1 hypothetical protein [Sphingobium subterraneum]